MFNDSEPIGTGSPTQAKTTARSRRALTGSMIAFLLSATLTAQANGKLQVHFIDVGQGDAALVISPQGETLLIDNGVKNDCDRPLAYLQQLGIAGVGYHLVSHYHADHIGCTTEVLRDFPLRLTAYDRGGQDAPTTEVYRDYLTAVGTHRQTAAAGTEMRLDATSQHAVTIRIITLNGHTTATENENDLSVVALLEFGQFRAEFGGDLSGELANNYHDIETGVAPLVGRIDVYKVHHHCSSHSTNTNWLRGTQPRVGIVSAGLGNRYGHPTQDCLDRLHAANVHTYWTSNGNGGTPDPSHDTVAGTVILEVAPGASTYTITRADQVVDTYPMWAAGTTPVGPPPIPAPVGGYAWSRPSRYYHYSSCSYVNSISPANLERGTTPPAGKTLHNGCPR